MNVTRRKFVRSAAVAAAGLVCSRSVGLAQRRDVTVGGRRIKTVDVHAHTAVPDALIDIVKGTPLEQAVRGQLNGNLVMNDARLQAMDAQGIDVEILTINAYWYGADLDLATRLIPAQNGALARVAAAHPDRFVPLATVALQHPELAADQLQQAFETHKMRGAGIAATVTGQELASSKFDPFWKRAESLGAMLFMHPQGVPELRQRLEGNGFLTNVIGNPLETTIALSHLIFEGTLDRYPNLKICGAHAGGYLASYSGRSDALCGRGGGDDCRALKRKPSEYFREHLYIDTMIFHESGLRHLVDEVGVSHIFYGTDYPFDWPVGIDFVLNSKFLSNADKEAILGGTLLKTLRITS